jgi:hypothetical protein
MDGCSTQLHPIRADIGRMSSLLHRSRRAFACLAVLSPLVAASAAQADRGGVPNNSGGDAPVMMQAAFAPHIPCSERYIEHPFAAWDDNADYFLIKEGNLGSDATYDWSFGGGELTAENNPFSLHPEEASSLSLGEGDSAESPTTCVTVDDPTMRFFVRNTGAETGTLRVTAVYLDENFDEHTYHLGTLTAEHAGDAWSPSPTLELAAPLVELLADGETPVSFRFTAEGEGSSWLVDDVYVDPYGKG